MPLPCPRALAALSLATLALSTVVGPSGPAVAAEAKAPSVRVISACLSAKTGKIRIVPKVADCRAGEDHIRWVRGAKRTEGTKGKRGVPGAKGATGATGQTGATGGIGPVGPAGPIGVAGAAGAAGQNGAEGAVGMQGEQGPEGAQGPRGLQGVQGVQGIQGNQGAPGPAGSGAMLSSSSGQVVSTTTVLGGVANSVAVLPISGAGSVSGVSITGGTIDATNSAVAGLAQPITGDHTLTGITGYFTSTNAMSLVGSTLTLRVQLWTSQTEDNVFTPVPGATCTLAPGLTGVLAIGTSTNCSTTGLAVPTSNGTQAILVVRSDVAAGLDRVSVLSGYWSAGLTLS